LSSDSGRKSTVTLRFEHSPWLNQASGALQPEVVAADHRDGDDPKASC
jgi:hypothetical protein